MFAGRSRQAPKGAYQVWLEPLEARRPCVQAICVRQRVLFLRSVSSAGENYFTSLRRAPSCLSTGCEGFGQNRTECFSAGLTETTSARRSQVSNLDPIRKENFGRGRSLCTALNPRLELNCRSRVAFLRVPSSVCTPNGQLSVAIRFAVLGSD